MPALQVARTSHGLVDALFTVIDRLNAKEIDAEHARAISHTAKTIVAVAELELEYRKFAVEGVPNLTSLVIEAKAT
jgi:hypothetical protein